MNTSFSFAQSELPQFFTLDGRLFEAGSATEPLLDGSVVMTVQILNPAKTCILYEETETVSTLATNGFFTARIGSATGAPERASRDSNNSMTTVFVNASAPITGKTSGGGGCTYTPAAGDVREFRFFITPSTVGSTAQLSDDMTVDSVPQALVSQTLRGLGPSNFFQTSATSTQAKLDNLLTTNYSTLSDVISGTSSLYLQNSANGTQLPTRATDPGTPSPGQIWYDSVTNEIKYFNGTTIEAVGSSGGAGVTSVTAGAGLSGGTITTTGTIDIATGGVTNAMLATGIDAAKVTVGTLPAGVVPTGTDNTKLPLDGSVAMSGALDLGANNLLNTGHITMNAQRTITIGRYDAAQQVTLIGVLGVPNAGASWYNTTTGKLMYWNGTAALELSESTTGGGDITAITTNAGSGLSGGVTSGPASLSVNVDGTTLEIATNTVQVKDAGIDANKLAAGAVTNGKLAADAVTSDKILNGEITDADINAAAAIAWSKIDKTGATAADVGAVPTARQVNTNAGSGLSGGGDLSANRNLSINVDDSTIEIATNTVQLKDGGVTTAKIANSAVTDAKIDTVSVNKITSALGQYFTYAPNGGACANGEVLKKTVNGWECGADATGGGVTDHGALTGLGDDDHTQYVMLAGRSGGQNLRGGTASGEDLTLESTSDATKGDVLIQPTSGNVGIGTTAPDVKLDVEGTIQIGDGGETCTIGANAGMVKYAAGALQYCNGSAWQTLGVSGAGLTNLNGQTGSTQTFAAGVSGLAPGWSSAADIHTFNIPLASGAGVTSGTISKVDYDAFSAKLSAVTGSALTSARLWVGDGTNLAQPVLLSGDVTMSNTGVVTIANDAITTAKIDDDAVTTAKIAADAVTSAKIDDDTITNADINSAAAIAWTKIDKTGATAGDVGAAPTSRNINTNAGSGLTGGGNLSADRSLSINVDDSTIEIATNTVQVKDGGVTSAKIANSAVTDAKIDTVSVNKITSALGQYFTYAPNGGACANGEVLKKTLNGWECGTDATGGGVTDHGALTGLGDDDHTQYVMLAGRSGGQNLRGGTASGEDLTLESTSNATKGDVLIQPTSGNVGIGTTAPDVKLDVEGTIQIGDGGETCTIGANAGMVKYAAGALQYCNGSAWQTLGVSGAGLTNLNGQTGSTQTFAAGVSGLAPGWSSAADIHTFNIPLASGAGVTSGTISKVDYDAFSAKLSAVTGSALTSARLWVGDGTNLAQPVLLSGDVTMSNTGVVTIANDAITTAKIDDDAVTTAKIAADAVTSAKIDDDTITNADINSAAAIAWTKIDKTGATAADVGAVPTSRQVNTNAGSGLTGGGDLTANRNLSLNVDNTTIEIATNTVQVKDGGIATAKIANSAVTDAKIDTVSVNKITSALGQYFTYAPNGGACANGEVLKKTLNGWECGTDATGGGVTDHGALTGLGDDDHTQYVMLAGRAGGQNLRGGTASGEDLTLESTSNATKGDVLIQPTSGNVGIGTTAPDVKLDVEGTIQIGDGGETCTIGANAGMVKYAAGALQYCNGSAWQTLGVSGAGLTTLNAQTGSTQTFATGATGLAPAWSSATNVHTLNIPLASGAGVTSGTISKVDYDAFTAKLSTVTGSSLTSARLWVGDGTNLAQPVLLSGDVTMSNTGAVTIANDAITTAKIDDDAVTTAKIAADAVTSAKIDDDTITNADINSAAAIAWTKIDKTGATAADVGAAPTSRNINTNAGSGLTGGGNLSADRSLSLNVDNTTIEIATNTVQVKDGGVTTAKIANSAVTDAKIDTVSVNKITSALGQYFTYAPNGGACANGEVLKKTLNGWECGVDSGGVTDHGLLSGLGDDDHTQYVMLAGRAGGQNLRGGTAANNNLTLESTSNATKGFVVLQPTGGNVGIGTTTPATRLDVEGTIQIGDGGETCSLAANAGMVKYASGALQYCNGSAWQTLGVSGAGLTTLNAQTGSTQTFATGATGLAPAWSSATNVHTLNIPLASGAGVTSGTISKVDYDAFTAKLSTVTGSALTSARLWVGDGTNLAQPVLLSGDVTMSNTGAVTIANNAITSAKINDGTIVNADINAAAAIAWSKIDKTGATAADVGAVPTARNINTNAGSGLTGGGNLSADRSLTINVDDSTIEIATNTVQLKDGGVTTAKIADGAVTDAKIDTVGVSKIANGVGQYFVYRPNNVACTNGQVLGWDNTNSRWICQASGGAPSGAAGGDLAGTYPNPTVGTGAITSAKILDGTIAAADLATGAVTTTQILDGTIAAGDIATGAVTTTQILDGTIAAGDIATGAVTTTQILNGTVAAADLASNSVTTVKITDANVTTAKIADGAVTDAKIGTVSVNKITSALGQYFTYAPNGGACANGEVLKKTLNGWECGVDSGGVTDHGLLSGLGDDDHTQYVMLAGRAGGQNLRGGTAASNNLTLESTSNATKGFVIMQPTGGNVGIGTTTPATRLDVEGTIQIGDGGETCSIAANAGMVKYASGALQYCNGSAWQTLGVSGAGLTTLNAQTGSTQTFATGAAGLAPAWSSATNVHTLNIPLASGAGVTSGTISKADYDAFTAKLSTVTGSALTSARLWVGDGSNLAQPVLLSGDVTMSNTGAVTIANNAITSAKILDGTIAAGDIATGAVTTTQILNGTVAAADLASNSVTTVKITDANVTTAKIADGAVTDAKIGTVSVSKIASGVGQYLTYAPNNVACTNGQVLGWDNTNSRWICQAAGGAPSGAAGGDLAGTYPNPTVGTGAITSAKILDGTIAAGDIATGAVTTTQILDGTVAAADLASNSVTTVKITDANVTTAKIADGAVTDAKIGTMSVNKITSALGQYFTYAPNGGACANGEVLKKTLNGWECGVDSGGVTDHGLLSGLGDDDHTQYVMLAGRAGGQNLIGGTAASNNLTLESTSNATKGFVIVQPTGGSVGIGTTAPGTVLDVAGAITSRPSGVGAGQTGQVVLRELAATGVNTVTLKAPDALTADRVLVFPDSNGTNGQALVTNGSGILSWGSVAPGGAAGGDLAGTYPNPTVGTGAITSAKILDGTIATGDIADNAIATAKIANGAVTDAKIGTVGVSKVASGVGQYFTYAPNNVACTNGQVLGWDNTNLRWICQASGGAPSGAAGGDLAGTYPNPTVGTGAITSAKILDGTIAAGDIATGAVTTTQILDGTIAAGDIATGAVTTTQILDGTVAAADLASNSVTTVKITDANVTTAKIANGAVTDAKIGTVSVSKVASGVGQYLTYAPNNVACTNGQVLGWDNTNSRWICQASGGAPSGAAGGDLAGTYPNPTVGTGAITSAKILDGTIAAADLATGAVTTTQILDGTIASGDIATGAVTTTQILDGTVAAADLASNSVTTVKITDANVTTAKIANGAVTDAKIGTVSVNKITSALGQYFTYAPNGGACANGEVLKKTLNGWECGVDSGGVTDHGLLTGLGDDDHTQYVMLAGRAGGQNLIGGTAASNNLTLESTSNATKGFVIVQPTGGSVGIGTTAPGTVLDVAGAITSRPSGIATGQTGQVVLRELAATGVNTVTLKAPDALTADRVLVFPDSNGTNGQALVTNGSGILSWGSVAPGGAAGGDLAGTYPNPTVGTGAITSAKILDGTIATGDIADNAIATAKIANGAVTDAKIGTVSVSKIANGAGQYFVYRPNNVACTNGQVLGWDNTNSRWICQASGGAPSGAAGGDLAGTYPNPTVGTGAITSAKILDGTIAAADLATGAVTTAQILDGTIAAGDIATGAVTTTQILDGTIAAGDIATGAVTTTQILNGTVAAADLASNSVTTIKITDANVTTAKIANGAVTDAKIGTMSVSKVASGVGQYLTYAPNNVACTNGQVLGWDNTNSRWICQASGGAPSGAAGGDLAGTYPNPTVGTGAITSAKILDGTIAAGDIAAGAVTTTQILDGTIAAGDIATGAVTTTQILDGTIAAGDIATGAVTTTQILNGTVAAADLASNSVTTVKITDANVTTAKIANGAVTDAKIGTMSVNKITSALGQYFTYAPNGGACANGEVLKKTLNGWECGTDTGGVTDHGLLSGLGDDDHTQYVMLAGRAGGQNLRGGTAASNNLTLESTSNATKGFVIVQPTGGSVGIGTTAPGTVLDVAGAITSRPSGIATGQTGQVVLRELAATGVNTVTLKAPDALTADRVLVFPDSNGTSGQALVTNGSGILSWGSVAPGGAAGGDLAGTYPNPTVGTGAITSAKILDGTIATGDIADNAIATAKIANGAVTDAKIGTVSVSKIANGAGQYFVYRPNNVACTNGQVLGWDNTNSRWICQASGGAPSGAAGGDLAGTYPNPTVGTGAITSAKILDGTIAAGDIAAGAVTTTQILDGTIAAGDIATSAVTTTQILDGTIATGDIADNAIATAKIANGAVTDAKIGTVGVSKVANGAGQYFVYRPNNVACANGQVLGWDNTNLRWICQASGGAPSGAAGGDLAGTYPNPTVGTGAITSAKILDGTIAAGDIAAGAVTTTQILDGTIAAGDIAAGAVTTTQILDGTIAAGDIATGAVTTTQILNGTVAAADLASNSVTTVKITDANVTTAKIANGAVTDAKIGTVSVSKIVNGAAQYFVYRPNNVACTNGQVLGWDNTNSRWICQAAGGAPSGAAGGDLAGTYPNPTVGTGAITSAKILDGTIAAGDIAAGAVTTTQILDGTIAAGDIATGAVTTTQILNGTVAAADLASNAVTTVKITDANVTTAKIANGAVTDAKIGTVSVSKIVNGAAQYFAYRPNNVACTNGQVLGWDNTNSRWICQASGGAPSGAAGGDLAGTYPNPTVGTGAITSAKILDGTIATGDIADNAIATAKIANGAVTDAKIGTVGVSKVANGAGQYFVYRPNNVACANGQVLGWDNTNLRWICQASGGAPSGAAGGDLAGTYPNPTVGTGAITSAKILDGTIAAGDIAAGAVTTTQILNGTIAAGDIAAGAVTTTQILNGTIAAGDIATGAVTTTQILNGTVAAGDLASNSVTTIKITDANVTTAKIANGAVTDAKIGTMSVNKITSALGQYFTYAPNGGACANGEVLKKTLNGWECAADSAGVTDHGLLAGLGDDDHTQYVMLAGRAGGQNLRGGTAASNNLTLESTSNATKGFVLIQPNGGDVGMGPTVTPATRLHITGASVADSSITLENTSVLPNSSGVYYRSAGFSYAGVVGQSPNSTSGFIRFMTSTGSVLTEHARVSELGNVGIGTTNPVEKLSVTGNIYVDNQIFAASGGGTPAAPAYSFYGSPNMGLSRVNSTDLAFSTGGVEGMRLNGSGNLGLGTGTVVNDKLHVAKPATDTLQVPLRLQNLSVTSTGGVGTGMLFKVHSTATDTNYKAGLVFERTAGNARGSLHFLNDNTADATNADLADSRMTITAAGNVGIGSTSPQAPLTVQGAIQINNNGNINGIGNMVIMADSDNDNSASYLAFGVDNTERVRIDLNGNVGIGTTNPTEKLEVVGTVKATELLLSSDRNLKTDIEPLHDMLGKIMQLQGVSYYWDRVRHPNQRFPNEQQLGFIAQEVEKVFPELVHGTEGKKSVNYVGLIAPMVQAMQQQQKTIESQQRQIDDLRKAVEELRKLK